MSITAADIRREVKRKVTFIRLMFSDILGTMKNVEFLPRMNSLTKSYPIKPCLMVLPSKVLSVSMNQICISILIWILGRSFLGR